MDYGSQVIISNFYVTFLSLCVCVCVCAFYIDVAYLIESVAFARNSTGRYSLFSPRSLFKLPFFSFFPFFLLLFFGPTQTRTFAARPHSNPITRAESTALVG